MTLTLKDSRFYALGQTDDLLSDLTPNLSICMATEQQVSQDFPRDASHGDATRILITFTNLRGNSTVYCLTDDKRLDSGFDIDGFMAGYHDALLTTALPDDSAASTNALLGSALCTALAFTLGVAPERTVHTAVKRQSEEVIKALCALVYHDPLDVVMFVKQRDSHGNPDAPNIAITALWALKTRAIV